MNKDDNNLSIDNEKSCDEIENDLAEDLKSFLTVDVSKQVLILIK